MKKVIIFPALTYFGTLLLGSVILPQNNVLQESYITGSSFIATLAVFWLLILANSTKELRKVEEKLNEKAQKLNKYMHYSISYIVTVFSYLAGVVIFKESTQSLATVYIASMGVLAGYFSYNILYIVKYNK